MAEQPPTASPTESAVRVLRDRASLIEHDLRERLDRAELPANLREAVKYSVFNGGKRLRPALVLLSCEAVGGDPDSVLAAASAMELIHCFSLVHDDLPAMDNDSLRRGQPTLHVHAGEAMAILAGDVMVSLAFEFIGQCTVSPSAQSLLMSELASATSAMIAGQVYDTIGGFDQDPATETQNSRCPKIADADAHKSKLDHALKRLHTIHRNKTGALMRASCRMGAIGGNASPALLEALTQYGEAMGFMFQIVDDLLDVTQSTEHIGKAAGKDLSAGKLTFPGVLGIEASRREVLRYREQALDSIAALGTAAQPLRDLALAMAVRTK